MKVGLVLAGGGFKGAYQIGAVRALREYGFTSFEMIAGTSAGALNAILVGNDDLETASTLWREKPFMQLASPVVLVHLLIISLAFVPFALAGFAALLKSGLNPYSSLWLKFPPRQLFDSRPWDNAWDAVLAGLLIAVTCVYYASSQVRRRFMFVKMDWLLVMTTILVVPALSVGLHNAGWLGVGFAAGWLWAKGALGAVQWCQDRSKLLSNAVILAEIDIQLKLHEIRRNTRSLFVTTSRGAALYDPFMENAPLRTTPIPLLAPLYDLRRSQPVLSMKWVPEYHDLCLKQSQEEVLELLRLTSAIPLVFQTGRSRDRELVVDGGLADNVPLYPLLNRGLDYIVVLTLEPLNRNNSARLMAQAWESHERTCLARMTTDEVTTLHRKWLAAGGRNGDQTIRRTLLPPMSPSEEPGLIVLGPQAPLSSVPFDCFVTNFVFGTLNGFLGPRRKWLEQGYVETRRQLEAGGWPRAVI